MAWCRQATSHYLNQCWPRFPTSYGVTRPQWVEEFNGPKFDWYLDNAARAIRLFYYSIFRFHDIRDPFQYKALSYLYRDFHYIIIIIIIIISIVIIIIIIIIIIIFIIIIMEGYYQDLLYSNVLNIFWENWYVL